MARKMYTVLGTGDGYTLNVAGVLAGDCRHLLCDSGYAGSWGHVVRQARDAHHAAEQAIDFYEATYLGGNVGQVHLEIVATPDRRVGWWGRRKAAKEVRNGGPRSTPLQIV